jgi:hypothetical protein
MIRTLNWLGGNYLVRPLYGKATYNQDGMATTHNADFMTDPRFAAAYEAGRATGSSTFGDPHWRAYVVCWAAERGAHLQGDFVEGGVDRGGYAPSVIKYLDFGRLPRRFYLLDTYEGLVERLISPEERAHGGPAGEYEPSYEAVVRTFAPSSNVEIVQGAVPAVASEQVMFLSLDMNTRDPEIAAAEYSGESWSAVRRSCSTTTGGASTSSRSGLSTSSPVTAGSRCCPSRPVKASS